MKIMKMFQEVLVVAKESNAINNKIKNLILAFVEKNNFLEKKLNIEKQNIKELLFNL